MSGSASGGVFISYRRRDTAPYARLLREELSKRLGAQQVFMDVDSIAVGVDFVEAIERAVDACQVLLALIGPQWLTAADTNGQRRLDSPNDRVRLEIQAALARDIRVIPILVDNTSMPRDDQVPDSLAPLVRRNALELSYNRYAYDLERLVNALGEVMGRAAAPKPASAEASPKAFSVPNTLANETRTQAVSLEDAIELVSRADASDDHKRDGKALVACL